MSNSADFITHQADILAYPTEDILRCTIPMSIYFAEAEALEKVCIEDQEVLVAAGLDWAKVVKLPSLTGAAREAQSLWVTDRFSSQEAQEAWNAKEEEAIELEMECLHGCSYAFRKDTYLLGRIKEIEEGSGQADLVQDLNDIAVLARENPKPLAAINFDPAKIDQCAAMADEMAELLAIKDSSSDKNERKVVRDKAFSMLKEVVDEIYACGQYCFWKDAERKKLYSSAFKRERNRKNYRGRRNKEMDSLT